MVYDQLSWKIASGYYRPGDRLPSEPELARSLGVARVTLRHALQQLENEGKILRRRPQGTIVSPLPGSGTKIILITSGTNPENISTPDIYSLNGIRTRCLELNWQVDCIAPAFTSEIDWAGQDCQGIILCSCNLPPSPPWLETIRQNRIPTVLMHCFEQDLDRSSFAAVITDHRRAWLDGLMHLLQFGHRRIAFINRDRRQFLLRNRLTAEEILEILEREGAEADPYLMFFDETIDLEAIVEKLLARPPLPTAVYCYSDFWAIQLYGILRRYKIRIPDDLAVMGFSGLPASALIRPSLSTVDFNFERQGRLAVDLLGQREKWQSLPVKPVLRLPAYVVPRESTDFFIMHMQDQKEKQP